MGTFAFDPNALGVVELQWIDFNWTFVHLYYLFVCRPINVCATVNETLKTENEQASTFSYNSYKIVSNFVDFYL